MNDFLCYNVIVKNNYCIFYGDEIKINEKKNEMRKDFEVSI